MVTNHQKRLPSDGIRTKPASGYRPKLGVMSDWLFEVAAERADPPTPEREYPITDLQMTQIRAAFECLNVDSMNDRQRLIESATIRPVGRLRDLSAVEARRVLKLLGARIDAPHAVRGSPWETREEDTWIDKL